MLVVVVVLVQVLQQAGEAAPAQMPYNDTLVLLTTHLERRRPAKPFESPPRAPLPSSITRDRPPSLLVLQGIALPPF